MAYCKQCGAYIPDGQGICLACGFDEAASAAPSAAQTAPENRGYSHANQELRDQLEKHRQEQKEKSQRWAEQQYARRQQQESSRQWAEEEYARRQAEKEQQAEQQRRAAGTVYRSVGTANEGANKLLGALSYLSVLFVLPYIFTPNDSFAKYHAKQGLKLFVFGIVADAIGSLTGFGWVISLLRLYFIYKGMSNALNGREEPLPYIGTIGDNK